MTSLCLRLGLILLALGFSQSSLALTDKTTIQGRLDIAQKDACLLVQVYLKNTESKSIKIITGRGGVDSDQDLTFRCDGYKCVGSRWSSASYRRDMKPVWTLIAPHAEIIYGKFILALPEISNPQGISMHLKSKDRLLETVLELYTDDNRDCCYCVNMKEAFSLHDPLK